MYISIWRTVSYLVKFSIQKAVSFDIRLAKYAGFMFSDLSTLTTRMETGYEKMMQLQLCSRDKNCPGRRMLLQDPNHTT